MSGNKKSMEKPLLFIHQPRFESSTFPKQQTSYVIKKVKISEETTQTKADIESIKEETKKETVTPTRSQGKKKLIEMDIEEKILFFLKGIPSNIPKPVCEILTGSETYKGIIASYEEGLVSIRTLTSPSKVKLNVKEITAINLLGL